MAKVATEDGGEKSTFTLTLPSTSTSTSTSGGDGGVAVAKIISESHAFKASLGNGFSLHTPMVALAMARLGASAKEIESHHSYAMEKNARYKLLPIEEIQTETSTPRSRGVSLVTASNWFRMCNMEGAHEASFRRFWRDEISTTGRVAAVTKCLSHMTDAVHSRLHHGVIRLAYAMEMEMQNEQEKDEEIAVALAAFCANYSPLRWTSNDNQEERERKGEVTNICEGFLALQQQQQQQGVLIRFDQRMGFAKKYGTFMKDPNYLRLVPRVSQGKSKLSTNEGLEGFVKHVVALYLSKPNILSLHMVTGLHALLVLRPYYTEEDFESTLDTHWISTAILYLSMKAPPLGLDGRTKIKTKTKTVSWDKIVAHALRSRSDHDIKFVDTCLFLHRTFPSQANLIQSAASTLVKEKETKEEV